MEKFDDLTFFIYSNLSLARVLMRTEWTCPYHPIPKPITIPERHFVRTVGNRLDETPYSYFVSQFSNPKTESNGPKFMSEYVNDTL